MDNLLDENGFGLWNGIFEDPTDEETAGIEPCPECECWECEC